MVLFDPYNLLINPEKIWWLVWEYINVEILTEWREYIYLYIAVKREREREMDPQLSHQAIKINTPGNLPLR